jgi:hypothetical protein
MSSMDKFNLVNNRYVTVNCSPAYIRSLSGLTSINKFAKSALPALRATEIPIGLVLKILFSDYNF